MRMCFMILLQCWPQGPRYSVEFFPFSIARRKQNHKATPAPNCHQSSPHNFDIFHIPSIPLLSFLVMMSLSPGERQKRTPRRKAPGAPTKDAVQPEPKLNTPNTTPYLFIHSIHYRRKVCHLRWQTFRCMAVSDLLFYRYAPKAFTTL